MNTKICHIFTLTVEIEKKQLTATLYTLKNINQQIFLAKSHENLMLPGRVDSIIESADFYP